MDGVQITSSSQYNGHDSIGTVLNATRNHYNRLGYRLRGAQSANSVQRLRETDAIFENIQQETRTLDQGKDSLRLSVDTMAKVDLGDFSSSEKSRGKETTRADNHYMQSKQELVPFGNLDIPGGPLRMIFGNSRETSALIANCLEPWREASKARYSHIRQLVIDLENGPGSSGFRTPFMKRMVEFADHMVLKSCWSTTIRPSTVSKNTLKGVEASSKRIGGACS